MTKLIETFAVRYCTARCHEERLLQNHDRHCNNSNTPRLESLWDISILELPRNKFKHIVKTLRCVVGVYPRDHVKGLNYFVQNEVHAIVLQNLEFVKVVICSFSIELVTVSTELPTPESVFLTLFCVIPVPVVGEASKTAAASID
jgi:hypothetical protein